MTREERLRSEPLGSLMLSLGLPSIAAQFVNVLYNIVDRIFIGHIPEVGDMALTGVGITFPIITLISAFSVLAGNGGAPLAAIELGKGKHDEADRILGTSTQILFWSGLVLTIVFLLFKRPVLMAFGASQNTIEYAVQYITIYLMGTLFVEMAIGLNSFISGQGDARTAMLSVFIGAGANIILDPLFIFVFKMGVRGAGIATVISQLMSAVWVTCYLCSSKSIIRIRRKYLRFDLQCFKKVMSLGISPFVMRSTESLVLVTLNSGLMAYGGDIHVGAMSIMTSIMQLVNVPVQGFAQGMQPIISYNYGAGNMKRAGRVIRRNIEICLAGTVLICGLCMFVPQIFSTMFTTNDELLRVTNSVMPVYFLGMTIFGVQIACQMAFVSLNQAKVSLFIALLRKVILLVPLALVLPKAFGVMGVYYAEPIADIISVITTATLFVITWKKLNATVNVN